MKKLVAAVLLLSGCMTAEAKQQPESPLRRHVDPKYRVVCYTDTEVKAVSCVHIPLEVVPGSRSE